VQACIPSSYNAYNGSIIVPINGTCIENAVNFDTTELRDKQQVRAASASREGDRGGDR
jgi:chitin synthase